MFLVENIEPLNVPIVHLFVHARDIEACKVQGHFRKFLPSVLKKKWLTAFKLRYFSNFACFFSHRALGHNVFFEISNFIIRTRIPSIRWL